jgi:hypothetical protein
MFLPQEGDAVIHKAKPASKEKLDRFDAARGKADISWKTDSLTALLRS